MSARTHKFTRDALIDVARRQLEAMPPGLTDHDADAMAAIVAIIEAYPLSQVAEKAVAIVVKDLRERRGFAGLIDSCGDWARIQSAIVERVAKTCLYTEPVRLIEPTTDSLDFDATVAPPTAELPAAIGEEMEFE